MPLPRPPRPSLLPLVLVAAPSFRPAVEGAEVEVFSSELPPADADRVTAWARQARQLFETAFGAVPGGETLRVVYSPRAGFDYSRTDLIVLSERWVIPRLANEDQLRGEIHGVAHEIAHFWWNLASSSTPSDWLNEALAEYSALRASEALYGGAEAERWRRRYVEHLRKAAPTTSIVETTADSEFRQVNWYERGALFLHDVEHRFGRSRLDAFLSSLRGRCAGAPLTTARFETWFVAEFGAEGQAVLDRWTHGLELPEG